MKNCIEYWASTSICSVGMKIPIFLFHVRFLRRTEQLQRCKEQCMKRNRLREYRKKNIKPGAADLDAIAVFPKGHILSHSVLFGRKTYLREGMKGRTFFYSQFCDKTEEKHSSVSTIQPVLCLVFCQLSSFFPMIIVLQCQGFLTGYCAAHDPFLSNQNTCSVFATS